VKKIFFITTFIILSASFATAQNNQIKFPLKKADYLSSKKKEVEAAWTQQYGKDEINFDEFAGKIIKAEEEKVKNYIANVKATLDKDFKTFSNNKNSLSKSDYVNAVSKIEEATFDSEDTNKDGVVTEEEHKAFLAKQKKPLAATPAPKK
jgi:hypothetical protein